MKTIFVLLTAVVLSVATSFSQESSLLELLRSDLRTQRSALMTAAMDLKDNQADPFWKIYREYDFEMTKIGDKSLALLKEYAAVYEKITDEQADKIMTQAFKNQELRLDLRNKYYKKIKKELGGIVAARFAQVDKQISDLIEVQIAAELPLIGKTEKKQDKEKKQDADMQAK